MKKQKKLLSFFIFLIILINILPIFTFAHSGRTDSQGGHYDRSTGGYHFHHGRPAHYHINGICPYSTTTNTKKNNTSNTYNNYNTNKNINNSSYENN